VRGTAIRGERRKPISPSRSVVEVEEAGGGTKPCDGGSLSRERGRSWGRKGREAYGAIDRHFLERGRDDRERRKRDGCKLAGLPVPWELDHEEAEAQEGKIGLFDIKRG